ncbi:MAG TPA: hypothetical protein PKK68_04890, partial [Methanothrix soehngenii]|nr:hypothetical protein [Methanothrix soehngenii]
MTIMAQNQSPPQVQEGKGITDEKLPDMMAISYKSDADMSRDEIMQGLMEISAMSLPEDGYHVPQTLYGMIRNEIRRS